MSQNQKIKVKICGLRRMADVEAVNRYRPDYIGFVFAKSKRQVSGYEAGRMAENLAPDIQKVGVFVDQSPELLAGLLLAGTLDFLQLHGREDAAYEDRLIELLEAGGVDDPCSHLIKVYRIRDRQDFEHLGQTRCKYLLLDAYSAQCEGGNGERFDWDLIRRPEQPFFLAGGIDIHNVERAIKDVRPYAVDVSSSLETQGFKNQEKIKDFMERIRSYE